MAKGILTIESQPSTLGRADKYNDWYNAVDLPEVLDVDGFVSATLWAPVDGSGPHVALYLIEACDLRAAFENLLDVARTGKFHMSDALPKEP